jgi:diguanylate cyclase (GGDEF)-like protein/PAS domain S-box-containing protein
MDDQYLHVMGAATLSLATDVIFIIDATTLRVTLANRAFTRVLGYSAAEVQQISLHELIAADRASVDQNLAKLTSQGEIYLGSRPYRRRDGSIAEMESRVGITVVDGRTLYCVVARDLTEIHHAEGSLRESQERFKTLADVAFEGIAITEEGRIVDVNHRCSELLGVPPAALLGRSVIDFVAPESRETVAQHFRSGSEAPYEHLALRADGTRVPVEVQAKNATIGGRNLRVTALRDVSERRRLEDHLRTSEANLRGLIDFSPVAMVLSRIADSTVLLVNRRAVVMFELPLDEIQGRPTPQHWVNLVHRQHYLEHVFRYGRIDDFESELQTSSGRRFWASLSGQRLRFAGEDALLAAVVDVTAQKHAREDLLVQATRDALTGAFNRRYVENVLSKEVERAERHARPLAVAILDADHFKRINDTHGHQTGDEVLRAITERCRNTVRSNDVFGRYGGEEFLIVFPETNLDEARIVAERLRAAVADEPFKVGEDTLRVTVSIGLAAYAPGHDTDKLLQRADAALYNAKLDGRNLVRQ